MDPNVSSGQSVQKAPNPQSSAPIPPPTSSAHPSPKRFSKKLLIIIGAVILVIVVIAVAIYFFMPKDTLKQADVTQPKADTFPYAVVNSEGVENADIIKEMAREISSYILSQRRPDGYYNYLAHYEQQCTEENGEKVCPFNGTNTFQTTNSWTALALFSASQILDDQNLLQEAMQDLNKLQEYCALDRASCNWVLAQPAIIYQATNNPELLEFLNLQGEVLLTSIPNENTMMIAIEARQLAQLYGILQETKYLAAAQNRLLRASQKLNDQPNLYSNTSAPRFAQSSCWIGLANSELAKTLKSEQEKSNTIAFLNNGNIEKNFNNFYNPIEIQPCIESYLLVDDLDGYKKLTNEFLLIFFDGMKNKLVYGEGGTRFTTQNGANSKWVGLTDSSYTTYLLYLLAINQSK